MKSLVLQNLIHRGSVLAEGFLFSPEVLSENEIRRRICALWERSAKVVRFETNLILLFNERRRVDCRSAPGLPLVGYGKILSAFPLRKKDLRLFEDFGETILFLKAGKMKRLALAGLEIENVEDWFETANFRVVETATLGEVNLKPKVIEKLAEIDIRRELKDVPKAAAEMFEILQTLREKTAPSAGKQTYREVQGGKGAGSAARNIFGSVFDAFKRFFSSPPAEQNYGHFSEPKPPSEFSNKLRQLLTRALFQIKVGRLIGRQQAKYLAEMMEKFESGDLRDALKYAIPLDDMRQLQQLTQKTPFLGFLRPRDDLRINYQKTAASNSSVFLEDNWFDDLRLLYRQTFDRLVAQNRLEEAAFVLAELLKNNAEAVEFLEKHGKFRLAAELAEARDLPKETIVRQWFIAGEKQRAIQLAVLHNAFEFVVGQLEQQKHPQAAEVRQIWAENLAAAGNFTAAVNAIWPLENRRRTAAGWIDKVIEFGGPPAARMLVKKLAHFPESFAGVKDKLQEILSENSLEAREKRVAFAQETIKLRVTEELKVLARPLCRKILSDLARGERLLTAYDLRQLVDLTGDYALRADLPKLSPKPASPMLEPLLTEVSGRDRGAARVFDACLLPDGKIAVALGEAGVKILSKDGRQIAHFDQPTERFVVSDLGTKAIGFAARDDIYRLSRFDFVERRANYWCEASFSVFAPVFDGNLWFVGVRDEVYAIDANAKNFEAVWRVAEIGGSVYEIAVSKNRLMLLVNLAGKGVEKWWYDLPGLTLRSRNQVKSWYEMKNENQFLAAIGSFVAHSVVVKQEIDETQPAKYEVEVYDYETRIGKFEFPPEITAVGKPQIVEKTYLLSKQTAEAAILTLYEIPNTHIASVYLKKSKSAAARLDEKYLTVTDELGRVIVFDHREKILRKNIRV